MRIILAITGASGIMYGIRLLEELHRAGAEVHLVISSAAKRIMAYETSYKLANLNKRYINTIVIAVFKIKLYILFTFI